MSDPLAQTYELLATTANPFAADLLMAGLDIPYPTIQKSVIQSVVLRGHVREQMEAIHRYPRLTPAAAKTLEHSAMKLAPAIRQCLMVGRSDWEAAALDLTRQGEAYSCVEMLLEILAGDRAELHETAIDTLRHLGNRLYDHLNGLGDPEADRLKNAPQIQQIVLKALNDSLASFHRLTHRETVVELILALGGPGHEITQNMINNASSECRALAKDLLMTSRHPGVMKFVLDSLSRTYPPARVIDALQKRDDPEFVLATLRWVPRRWTNTQERNLRQIESISWTGSSDQVFTIVPEELQTAMLTFVLSTGISREEKSEIRQWLVRFGSPEARTAAAEILKELDSETVQEIVCDSLESEDPEVQAWATKQLRSQHVPDALQKLIDQLDNPSVSVQEVARQELHGFDLECLLSRQEVLSPRARANASRLLEKVDPGYLTKLVNELHNPIRRRRLRAIRGTLAFGWNVEVTDELLGLLKDDDTLIRRAAVEVLAPVRSANVISALAALKNDPSERVRDTVQKALAQTAAKKTVPDAPSIS